MPAILNAKKEALIATYLAARAVAPDSAENQAAEAELETLYWQMVEAAVARSINKETLALEFSPAADRYVIGDWWISVCWTGG